MKLVTKQELHARPSGTIYSSYQGNDPWRQELFTDLHVKGDSLPCKGRQFDFVTTPLLPSLSSDSAGGIDFLWSTSREGTFDDSMVYWVWDELDRQRLAHALLDPGNRHLWSGTTRVTSDSFDIRFPYGDLEICSKGAA
ncbi:hypothetical protein CN140_01650 [Sinorhizobium meliloti]|uniref:hypothetical protein n=1 Tax=Rhizobium meliloti TaxID=382 RepID=UPI000FD8155C|nr:hypothetical protein [Sinorhizobium meliloti]RVL87661.1 hypothetical protein CN140_01650 [Sinorhizobium meliloti]